jgi:hypothetical protein
LHYTILLGQIAKANLLKEDRVSEVGTSPQDILYFTLRPWPIVGCHHSQFQRAQIRRPSGKTVVDVRQNHTAVHCSRSGPEPEVELLRLVELLQAGDFLRIESPLKSPDDASGECFRRTDIVTRIRGYDRDVQAYNAFWMTEKELTERIQKLWVQATASCGSATPQLVEEIRELERMIEKLREKQTS